jgi:hypothetical protein
MTGVTPVSDKTTGNRVITYDDVVTRGAARFDATSTIDLIELASDLAVSRATLYRVIEGRDRVIGDVLWHFASAHHRHAVAAASGVGVERVIGALRSFGEAILGQASFRGFITGEPDTATRVLFTHAGGVHERFVEANAALLGSEPEDAALSLPFDLDTTAYVLSRIYESMWYADLLSGREPDLDVADGAARAVLTGVATA